MRRYLLTFACSFLLAVPAWANSGGGKKEGASNHFKANWPTIEEEKLPAVGSAKRASHAVDIPMVILPVSEHGRLTNYLFLSVRLNLNESKDAWPLRAKSQFLSDAIIRLSHKHTVLLTEPDEIGNLEVNTAKLKEMVLTAIAPWVGQDMINSVEFPKINLQR